jgi:adenylate cyclase
VGNVGATHRYNYTAVGETVNVAARLESLPGEYGCPIILGPGTAARLTNEYLLCEIDCVRVKGKTDPISVFWPIALAAEATPAEHLYVEHYAKALEGYREGRFAEAVALWATLHDPRNSGKHPASVMAERARSMKRTPQWSGVWTKDTK